MEFTLLGAVFVAIVPMYLVLYWEAKRGNAASCVRNLWDVALGAMVAGVFVGRIAAMAMDGVNPITHPADILIIRGGVATVPATTAAIATAAWLGRKGLWPVLDGLAAAAVAGLGGWHAGCVVRDSCLGTASSLPWAIAQPGSPVTRHPVEVYAAVGLLLVAALIALARRHRQPVPGIAAGIALTAAALVRLATEPLRPHLGSGLVWAYLLGVLVGVAFIGTRLRDSRQSDSGPSPTDSTKGWRFAADDGDSR